MRSLFVAMALPVLGWSGSLFCVSLAGISANCSVEGHEKVSVPGINTKVAVASATRSPWLDSNAWKFRRKPDGKYFYEVPPAKAALAVAEAFVYGADAAIRVTEDVPRAAAITEFFSKLKQSRSPLADFAFVDDGSREAGEVMNLLTRRNLLFERVTQPSSQSKVLRIGSPDFPKSLAANPSEFAYKVRQWLKDDARSLRIYGTENVLAYVTQDRDRVRVHLLNYSGNIVDGIRVRLRGKFQSVDLKLLDVPNAKAQDLSTGQDATELTITLLKEYGAVDFRR